MTNKEKKAIEYLKTRILPYYGSKGRIEFMLNDIILNLIETQQKEIEELKNTETYKIAIIDKDNYISKDKIKEKIEEYNKMINATYADLTYYADYRRDVCHEIKNVLQVLLEEE